MAGRQNIWFFTEGVSYRHPAKGTTRGWIREVVRGEGFRPGAINIIFCSDEYLHEINYKYLKHNTLTDIITFDLSEGKGMITGDIYISVERARENARSIGVKVEDEIRRLIVHGILHLAGHRDKAPADKKEMTQKEDYYLSLPSN